MQTSVRLAIENYRCRNCAEKRGLEVRALVRMIPQSAIVDGKLVGDEMWGCPVCHTPKFNLKREPFQTKGKTMRP